MPRQFGLKPVKARDVETEAVVEVDAPPPLCSPASWRGHSNRLSTLDRTQEMSGSPALSEKLAGVTESAGPPECGPWRSR